MNTRATSWVTPGDETSCFRARHKSWSWLTTVRPWSHAVRCARIQLSTPPRRLLWTSSTVNKIQTATFKNRVQIKSRSEICSVLLPDPCLALPPAWRGWTRLKCPLHFLINSRSLTISFWEFASLSSPVLMRWWKWLLKALWFFCTSDFHLRLLL